MEKYLISINLFGANFTKWSNTHKQFVGNLSMICLSVFNHFVGLALKGLITEIIEQGLWTLLYYICCRHWKCTVWWKTKTSQWRYCWTDFRPMFPFFTPWKPLVLCFQRVLKNNVGMKWVKNNFLTNIFPIIWDVLRNLVSFVQFKKREKHPWMSVTFSEFED